MKPTEKTHLERKKDIATAGKISGQKKRTTSYDTSKQQTSTPQNVRESTESSAQQARSKKGKEKSTD